MKDTAFKNSIRLCHSFTFISFYLFTTLSAQNPCDFSDGRSYADAKVSSLQGLDMYEAMLLHPTELNDSNSMKELSHSKVYYHYINEWETTCSVLNDQVCLWGGDIPAYHCYVCQDQYLQNQEKWDNSSLYWNFWDAFTGGFLHDCNKDDLAFINMEVSSNQFPNTLDPDFRFNFDDHDHKNVRQLPSPERPSANYHSFNLYEYGDSDIIIPELLSPTPPSGSRSMKIGNDNDRLSDFGHINKLSRNFYNEDKEEYTFSYAIVMEDPDHGAPLNPYFSARLLHQGTVVDELCIIANQNDIGQNIVEHPDGNGLVPIVYIPWQCASFDLKEYQQKHMTIEFIASDCRLLAHFGYAYVSDICEECCSNNNLIVELREEECSGVYDICGNLDLCDGFTFQSLEVQLWQDGEEIRTLDISDQYDPVTGDFCYELMSAESDLEGLNGSFDIYIVSRLLNTNLQAVDIRSLTLKENGVRDMDNDIYLEDGEVIFCCPTNFSTSAVLASSDLLFYDPDCETEAIFELLFTLLVPDGYDYCHILPSIEGAQSEFNIIEHQDENGQEYVVFAGILNLYDFMVYEENDQLIGTVMLCNSEEGFACSVDFTLAFPHVCPANGILCDFVNCIHEEDYEPHPGNYIVDEVVRVNFSTDLFYPSCDDCQVSDYTLRVEDYSGSLVYNLTIPAALPNNGPVHLYQEVPLVYTGECFNVRLSNNCSHYCEYELCIDDLGRTCLEEDGLVGLRSEIISNKADSDNIQALTIAPNPSSRLVHLIYNKLDGWSGKVNFFTPSGANVFEQTLLIETSKTIQLPDVMREGLYIVVFQRSNGETSVEKLILLAE